MKGVRPHIDNGGWCRVPNVCRYFGIDMAEFTDLIADQDSELRFSLVIEECIERPEESWPALIRATHGGSGSPPRTFPHKTYRGSAEASERLRFPTRSYGPWFCAAPMG